MAAPEHAGRRFDSIIKALAPGRASSGGKPWSLLSSPPLKQRIIGLHELDVATVWIRRHDTGIGRVSREWCCAVRTFKYRCCLVTIMLLALSGCAGWLDPMVAAGNRPQAPTQLSAALDYANRSKDEYFAAMSNQARLTSWVGAGLIPLAAVTGGFALAGQAGTATILGLTGTGIYATSLWLRNQPGQLAYLAGYEATNCAILAVAPFAPAVLVSGERGKGLTFVEALEDIPRLTLEVRNAASNVRSQVASRPPQIDPALASEALATADAVIAEAAEARRNGLAVQAIARTLGDHLVAAVDRINAEVNGAVIRGQPDINALASVVGGIGGVYQQFGQVPVSKTPPEPAPEGPAPQAFSLDNLEQATGELAAAQTIVAATVNAVAGQTPTDALSNCGVDADQIVAALSVEPAGPYAFPSGIEHTQGFLVRGGRSPYGATVTTATPDVTVDPVEMFGPAFVIKSTGEGEGTYPILVRDGGGRSLFINVEIPKGETPATGPRGTSEVRCEDRPGDPVANCATRDEIIAMQRALCMPEKWQTGTWAGISRDYLKSWIIREKLQEPSDRLTEDLKAELLEISNDPARLDANCGAALLRTNLQTLTDKVRGQLIDAGPGASPSIYYYVRAADIRGRVAHIELCLLQEPRLSDNELRVAILEKAGLQVSVVTPDVIIFVNKDGEEIAATAIPAC